MFLWSRWLFWEKMQYLNFHTLLPLGSWNIYFSLNYSSKQILQQVMLINKAPHNHTQENNKLWSSPSWSSPSLAWNSFDWSHIASCDFLQHNNMEKWASQLSCYFYQLHSCWWDEEANSHGSASMRQLKQQELEFIGRPFFCLRKSRSQLMRIWKVQFLQVQQYRDAHEGKSWEPLPASLVQSVASLGAQWQRIHL